MPCLLTKCYRYNAPFVKTDEYWLGYSDAAHNLPNEQFSASYMMGYKAYTDWLYEEFFSEQGYGQCYIGEPYDNPYDGEEAEWFKEGYESRLGELNRKG